MKSFSLRRLANYARYHYTVTRQNYIRLAVAVLAGPVLFGIMNKSIWVATNILVAIYLFLGISVAVACTRSMRDRGTRVIDGMLPVSTVERYVFNVLNLSVVYPVAFAILSALSLAVVSLFNEFPMTFGQCFEHMLSEAFLMWPVYVLVQIVCSSSLLINLLARRSLVLAYVIAFMLLIAFVWLLTWIGVECYYSFYDNMSSIEFGEGDIKVAESIIKSVYVLIPIVFYSLGYVAMRKRQVKW